MTAILGKTRAGWWRLWNGYCWCFWRTDKRHAGICCKASLIPVTQKAHMWDYPARIENNYGILNRGVSLTFTCRLQSGLNLCVADSSIPMLAFRCLMLPGKHLAYITTYSHDTETAQMSQYGLDAFFCNWFWIRNGILGMIHGASHSFVLAKSFLARPSGICCYWQEFIDLIHSPSFSVCFF